ncbi:unnamed protein product, partial [Cyprideis torosa]
PLEGKTALMEAAAEGHYPAALWLLREFGADVNAQDFESHTPLHYACLAGRPIIASLLLREGALVEARDNGGRTPLFAASLTGHPITLRLLHRFGANPAATDGECIVGRDYTVSANPGHRGITYVEALYSRGS